MDIQDRKKSLTAEELRQRYNLEDISKNKKAIQVQKDSITKLDAHLEDFIDATVENLQELQDQVDGNITTWFYSGVPTLSNEPAVDWTTDTEKDKHLGDLYYDQATGYAYRFQKTNNVYSWLKLTDSDVTEALAIANAAQDTADSKRRVFVVQPTPPYDIGDIWIKEDKDLYRCQTATVEGGTYNPSHWIIATKYTDDTVALQAKQELDQFKVDVQETYATNAELITTTNSITGRVEETYTYITTVENNIQNQIGDITTTTQVSTGNNNLYTEEAVEGNALGYLVDGATEQQTYTGKNLFDGSKGRLGTYYGLTISYTNGQIILNGTPTTNIDLYLYNTTYVNEDLYNYLNNSLGTYRLSNSLGFENYIQVQSGYKSNTATITSQDQTIRAFVRIPANRTFTNQVINIQLELGSTATTYEPYVGGTPSPNPNYPQEVKTIPSIINLFDKDNANIINGSFSASDSITINNNVRSIYIPCKANTSYIISKSITSNRYRAGTTNEIPALGVSVKNVHSNDGGKTLRVTSDNNSKYLIVYYWVNGDTSAEQEIRNSIQIEEGSVSHEYVPYGYWSKVKVTGKNLFNKDNANIINASINTSTNTIVTNADYKVLYIPCKPNTTYTVSKVASNYLNVGYTEIEPSNGVNCYGYISSTSPNIKLTIETGNNAKYLFVRFYKASTDTLTEQEILDSIQIEQSETSTSFEPYKENQVLIDMSKENLFDNTIYQENKVIQDVGVTSNNNSFNLYKTYIKPNTKYTISITSTSSSQYDCRICAFKNDDTFISMTTRFVTPANSKTTYTFTTQDNASYILYHIQKDSNNITIYEGNNPTPYYELCKIGDYKDTLSIDSSGNVVVNKVISKVVLNGSENWQQWGSQTLTNTILCGTTILDNIPRVGYVQMSNYFTGQPSTIWATDVEGVTVSDTGTTVLRFRINKTTAGGLNSFKTWLSTHNTDVYYVLATPETINLPNTKIPLFEGINHVTFVDDLETDTSISLYRKTPLTGTFATVTQLKDLDTQKTTQITQIRNEMLVDLNTERLRIDSINQTIDETGVPILNTGTGYVFDSEGLKIEKTNQDVKSQLDNDGLSVKYNDADVLTARSNGVNAVNMTVNKFYVQRPIRMEKTKSISDSTSIGLGFYYVGEE